MQNIIESIIFSFSQILNYRTIKSVFGIGVVVTIIWSIIGYLMWPWIISFSSYFLDLIPFSMLRANGAWILSSFLWFSLVLITFAIIMAFFGSMILEKISREKYSSFSLILIFMSALFWSVVWFFKASYMHDQFLRLLNWLPFETTEVSLSYMLGFYFIYNAITISLLFTSSFFSEKLLKDVQEKEFPYEPVLDEDEVTTSEHRIKDFFIYIVASVLVFPLLFIPVLNFIIQMSLWVWLIKDTFVDDSSALIIEQEKRKTLSEYKAGFITISCVTALFNFLPVLNIFGPFFGEIAMFKYLKTIQKEL